METRTITLRLPADLLDRIEALVPTMARSERFRSTRVTRTVAISEALYHGVEALESQHRGVPERSGTKIFGGS